MSGNMLTDSKEKYKMMSGNMLTDNKEKYKMTCLLNISRNFIDSNKCCMLLLTKRKGCKSETENGNYLSNSKDGKRNIRKNSSIFIS